MDKDSRESDVVIMIKIFGAVQQLSSNFRLIPL